MDNPFHALPTQLLFVVCDFPENPTNVCCLALTSTRLAQVASRRPVLLSRLSQKYDRASILRALSEGLRMCRFGWSARPFDRSYWERNKNELADWQSREETTADFDASVVESIDDWCEGKEQTSDDVERDEPFPLALAAARCLQQAYGFKSQEDVDAMGHGVHHVLCK